MDIAAVVMMFPGAILAMAAGAMFGITMGCVLTYIGTCIGQTLAFIVGRCSPLSSVGPLPPK